MRQKAVVIGAGIGGIATATLLARAGYDVHVYEKNAQPGGRAGQLRKDGFTFDTGPSWYLMPEVFEHYFELIGTSTARELDIIQLQPAYKVYFEHEQPLTITTDPTIDEQTFEDIEPGAGARLRHYVRRCTRVYDLALENFLYTNFSSLRDFLKPAVLLNGPRMLGMAVTSMDRFVSQYFRDPRLKKILEYTMVFLGASPYKAPAIYSLMGALDFRYGVYYPQGGMYSVIEAMMRLSKRAGVTYHFNTPVEQIVTANKRATYVQLMSGDKIPVDVVVSNADLHHTETQLLAPADQTYPESYWRSRDPGPSALLMYLGVRGELPELEHHSLLFVDSWRENFDAIYETHTVPEPASIYLSKASATDVAVAPEGCESVVVLVPFPAGVSLSHSELKKISNSYLAQIERMTGIADFAARVVSRTIVGPDDFARDFNAWRSTALGPAHTLRQSAFFRTRNRSKKLENLYYVGGSTLPGIGLPMCLISAELVYKHLARDRRGGRVTEIKRLTGEEKK